MDEEGYFYRMTGGPQGGADLGATRRELVAQIERAKNAGIDITHIDSHMFTLMHPKFLGLYIELAELYKVPAFLLRPDSGVLDWMGFEGEEKALMSGLLAEAEAKGMPTFDHAVMLPLENLESRLDFCVDAFGKMPAGLTYMILHPNKDTPELRTMAPDWEARVDDYETFHSQAFRDAVEASGVRVVGMRALRDAMRGG
jgi:predicted glycoside hydrolase/deacetylase ChbG (UPF0249 family)